jgi:stage II sporulation protein AA (anti-sigma F factor antagonist)
MIQTFEDAGRLRIALDGRLDTARSAAIGEELLRQVDAASCPVVFDLKDADFVTSAFLRLCIIAAQRLGAGRLIVANANPLVRKVFAIAGLDRHFLME